MTSNLRVKFCERQRKHLFKSIDVNLIPSKKACSKPVSVPPLVPVPSTIAVEIIPKLDEKLSSTDDTVEANPFIHQQRNSNTKRESAIFGYSMDPDRDKQLSQWIFYNMTFVWHPGLRHFPHYAHARLHDFWNSRNGKMSPIFCSFFLSLLFHNYFPTASSCDSQSLKPHASASLDLLLVGSSQNHDGIPGP